MPYHRPIPEPESRGKSAAADKSAAAGKRSGAFAAWVQAEKFIQIVLVLPSGAFIGWVLGIWLDNVFHQTWLAPVGVVVGIIAGLVSAIRMAVFYTTSSERKGNNGDGTDDSGPGQQP